MFIFTPEDVDYCSDIYVFDAFLIAFKYPTTYVCLLSALTMILLIIKVKRKRY